MATPTQRMGKGLPGQAKSRMSYGYFYFFLRNRGPMFDIPGVGEVALGHMGWAFQFNDEGSHYMGSLENTSGNPVVVGDAQIVAGYWYIARSGGADSVFREMATMETAEQRFGFRSEQIISGSPYAVQNNMSPYDQWKSVYVENPDPNKALRRVQRWGEGSIGDISYVAMLQNCLDNAVTVALDYGVKGLPWRANHPAPATYFYAIDATDGGDVPLL